MIVSCRYTVRPILWLESSTDILCSADSVNWMVSVHWGSFVFGVMALTIFKQMLLNFNTFNHFKVVKCLQMAKPKHLRKVKQNWKRLFSVFFFVTFSKGGTIRQKANARAWNHADRSNSKIEWRTHLSNHGLIGVWVICELRVSEFVSLWVVSLRVESLRVTSFERKLLQYLIKMQETHIYRG